MARHPHGIFERDTGSKPSAAQPVGAARSLQSSSRENLIASHLFSAGAACPGSCEHPAPTSVVEQLVTRPFSGSVERASRREARAITGAMSRRGARPSHLAARPALAHFDIPDLSKAAATKAVRCVNPQTLSAHYSGLPEITAPAKSPKELARTILDDLRGAAAAQGRCPLGREAEAIPILYVAGQLRGLAPRHGESSGAAVRIGAPSEWVVCAWGFATRIEIALWLAHRLRGLSRPDTELKSVQALAEVIYAKMPCYGTQADSAGRSPRLAVPGGSQARCFRELPSGRGAGERCEELLLARAREGSSQTEEADAISGARTEGLQRWRACCASPADGPRTTHPGARRRTSRGPPALAHPLGAAAVLTRA